MSRADGTEVQILHTHTQTNTMARTKVRTCTCMRVGLRGVALSITGIATAHLSADLVSEGAACAFSLLAEAPTVCFFTR